jgi:DNA-binding Xre family transcriptional regulator
MFSKQDTVSIDTIYEIAEAIGCEPIDLLPKLEDVKE